MTAGKLTRRQFGQVSSLAAVSVLRGNAASPASPLDSLDRWVATDPRSLFAPEENCWHPQLIRLHSGELLLSFLLGHPPRTMLMRSRDGENWNQPELVSGRFDHTGGGGWGLVQTSSGRLLMSYLDIDPWPKPPQWPWSSEPRKIGMWPDRGLNPWAPAPGNTKLSLRTLCSDDEGRKWNESPLALPRGLAGAIPHGSGPIVESQGVLYMPVWAWLSPEETGNCALLESRDDGLNWTLGAIVARQNQTGRLEEYRELCVHVLPDGEWLAICRANLPNWYGLRNVSMHVARSKDGRTWTEPIPSLIALASPRVLTLPDQGICALGAWSEGLRDLFSYNGGRSWAFEDIVFTRDARNAGGRLDLGSVAPVVIGPDRVLVVYYSTQERGKELVNRLESVWLQKIPAAEAVAR